MSTYHFVTPSTRGIGLALTRHLLSTTPPTTHIIGTHRPTTSPNSVRDTILSDLPDAPEKDERLHLVPLDFTDEGTITHAIRTELPRIIKQKHGGRLSRAYLLPGILRPEKSLKTIRMADMLATFRINTVAPTIMLSELMLSGLLPRSRPVSKHDVAADRPDCRVVVMAARVGSVSDNRLGGWYSYRMSKSAVFQLVKTAQLEFERVYAGRVSVLGYHPGTVRTGLSEAFWQGENWEEGRFEVDEAVKRMVKVVEERGVGEGGRVWDWKGTEVLP